MITVFALMYNEALMLPYFVKHYREMFPDCRIVLYDNESTDTSVKIAGQMDCEVRTFVTGGKLSDRTYLDIKNHCWKDAETDWVLVCDVDEHCLINEKALKRESQGGATVIQFQGYNMVNHNNNLEIENIHSGVRAPSYDKAYLFKRTEITEINYTWGAHGSCAIGRKQKSERNFICKHYKYVNVDYMVKRHAHYASRMSNENKDKGLGFHYTYTADRIRAEFAEARRNAIKIL